MSGKNVTSLFYLEKGILGKDFFLAPLYLSLELDWKFNFVYPRLDKNIDFPLTYRNANLIPINSDSEFEFSLWKERSSVLYLIKNAKNIDLLFLTWLNPRTLLLSLVYKLLNKNGFVFVKGDINEIDILKISISPKKENQIKKKIKEYIYSKINVLTCETKSSYDKIKKGALGITLSNKIVLLPNGFDEVARLESNMKIKKYEEKENIILVVGRIGDKNKNHELILEAIKEIDLNNWKIIFIGPVENDFEIKVMQFEQDYPKHKDVIKLMGPVYNNKELWEFYNRSKVFLLTSNKEGFPNVFAEALRFGCYIVTTRVSSATDITNDETVGTIIEIGNINQLKTVLHNLVYKNIDLQSNYIRALNLSETRFLWTKNIEKIIKNTNLKQIH